MKFINWIKSLFYQGKAKVIKTEPKLPEAVTPIPEGSANIDLYKLVVAIEEKFGDFSKKREEGTLAILFECKKQGLLADEAAYMLATAWHETNKTMEPVIEAYWLSETWRKNNLRYYPFYGRGYVQLTHEYNYKKYGIDKDPEKAREIAKAAFILVDGSKHGKFTGRKLSHYRMNGKFNALEARRIINGRDKQGIVAGYYERFYEAIKNVYQ